jgi:hypothetical protein
MSPVERQKWASGLELKMTASRKRLFRGGCVKVPASVNLFLEAGKSVSSVIKK